MHSEVTQEEADLSSLSSTITEDQSTLLPLLVLLRARKYATGTGTGASDEQGSKETARMIKSYNYEIP